MDDLNRLEAEFAALHTILHQSSHYRHDLINLTNKAKEIVKEHREASIKARASSTTTEQLAEIELSSERLAALQLSFHKSVVEAQRRSISGSALKGQNGKDVKKSSDPADSYAADITTRLVGLNDRFQDSIESSNQNVSSLERSVNSVRSLSTRYKAFGEVSGESRRLVSKHAAKKRRDLLMMKAAVAWFLLVCAVIFLKRLRILWFILSLLYKFLNMFVPRRTKVVPDIQQPQQYEL